MKLREHRFAAHTTPVAKRECPKGQFSTTICRGSSPTRSEAAAAFERVRCAPKLFGNRCLPFALRNPHERGLRRVCSRPTLFLALCALDVSKIRLNGELAGQTVRDEPRGTNLAERTSRNEPRGTNRAFQSSLELLGIPRTARSSSNSASSRSLERASSELPAAAVG